MAPGYLIVGVIWTACTASLLAMGITESIAAAALGALFASAIGAPPVALVAAGLWRSSRAAMAAVRTRRGRHQPLRGAR